MTVDVAQPPIPGIDTEELSAFAESVLTREGVGDQAHLSISFVDLDTMASLNERYMAKPGPTDVLSFPIEDASPGNPPRGEPEGPPLVLGDIVLSTDVIADHAEDFDVTFEDELHLMVVHGVLHILGWDHESDDEAEAMERREAEHLATIGKVRR